MSGIYCIQNIITKDGYIGSSNNLKTRFICHKSSLKHNKHKNIKLQLAVNKYSLENFEFYIIAKCPIEYLAKLEQWFINNLKPEYNIALHTESFRRGKINSKEHQDKIINTRRINGTLERISKNMLGNQFAKDQKRTKQEIDNLQKARKEKFIKRVLQFDLSGNLIKEHKDTVSAGKSVNLSYKSIHKCCNDKLNKFTAAGFKWKYKN